MQSPIDISVDMPYYQVMAQRETTTKGGTMSTTRKTSRCMVRFHSADRTYSVTAVNDKGKPATFHGFATRLLAMEFAPYIRMGATNPVVFTDTAYGSTLRRYANGMWDATDGPCSLSPGFASEDDLRYWLAKESERLLAEREAHQVDRLGNPLEQSIARGRLGV